MLNNAKKHPGSVNQSLPAMVNVADYFAVAVISATLKGRSVTRQILHVAVAWGKMNNGHSGNDVGAERWKTPLQQFE